MFERWQLKYTILSWYLVIPSDIFMKTKKEKVEDKNWCDYSIVTKTTFVTFKLEYTTTLYSKNEAVYPQLINGPFCDRPT
jgi:hypothetical protein